MTSGQNCQKPLAYQESNRIIIMIWHIVIYVDYDTSHILYIYIYIYIPPFCVFADYVFKHATGYSEYFIVFQNIYVHILNFGICELGW